MSDIAAYRVGSALEPVERGGRSWGHAHTLLLTVADRHGGRPSTSSLFFVTDDDDYLVVASTGGAPEIPRWYRDLTTNPRAAIRVRACRLPVIARTASVEETPRLWDLFCARWPQYDLYRSRSGRCIPVVVLSLAATHR